jgi:hypothetical protein
MAEQKLIIVNKSHELNSLKSVMYCMFIKLTLENEKREFL